MLGVGAVNGKVYAFASNKTLVYNPTTDTLATKNPQQSNMYGAAFAVYQNKIYPVGQGYARTQVLDPEAETWEIKTSMPTPRTQLEANVVNGKIYLTGDRTGGQYSQSV
jgi:hypothetical protein